MCNNTNITTNSQHPSQEGTGGGSVTILIPVYNVERYIGECAESLFGQTYADIEYVFCDDCTPDNSVAAIDEVLDRYPERREHVRIIRMEHNTGIGGVRARLVGEVRTEWFTFADSDDILPLDAIEVLVKRMQESEADIVDGAYQEYRSGELGTMVLPFHGSQSDYQHKLLCQNILKTNVWGRLYRTSVLERADKLFETGIDYAEDYSAITRLALVTRRAWTDKVVYHYRTDNASSYTKTMSRKNVLSCLHATRRVLFFCLWRGHLPLSVEIGTLNMYRLCKQNGVSVADADEVLQFYPEHWVTQILRFFLRRGGVVYSIGDKLYKLTRCIANIL